MHQSVVYVDDSFLKEAAEEPGNTAVAFEAVKWQTLHCLIEKQKMKALKKHKAHFESKMTLSVKAKTKFILWKENIFTFTWSLLQKPHIM